MPVGATLVTRGAVRFRDGFCHEGIHVQLSLGEANTFINTR